MHFGEANRSLPSINNRDGLLFKSPSPTRQCIFLCPPPRCRHLLRFHLYTTATTRRHRGRVVTRWGKRTAEQRQLSTSGLTEEARQHDWRQESFHSFVRYASRRGAIHFCISSLLECKFYMFWLICWNMKLWGTMSPGSIFAFALTCWTQSKWRIYAHGRSPYFGCSILCTTRPSLTAVAGTQPVSVLSSEHQPEICYL
jgi:hypothetical protein